MPCRLAVPCSTSSLVLPCHGRACPDETCTTSLAIRMPVHAQCPYPHRPADSDSPYTCSPTYPPAFLYASLPDPSKCFQVLGSLLPSMSVALATALLILVQHASGAKHITLPTTGPASTTKGPIITTFAGNGSQAGFAGDGGPATAALLLAPTSVAVGTDGSVYIADLYINHIRVVNPAGIITSLTKNFTITAIALGPDGSIYASDYLGCVVRRITRKGKVSIVAGNGTCGFSGDGGPATSAGLIMPGGLAVGPDGSLYIACESTCSVCPASDWWTGARVRRVSPSGIITTFAGTEKHDHIMWHDEDGIPATQSLLTQPNDVAVGPDGSVYIADGNKVRRVLPSGIIVTHAGNGASGYSGDGGPALSATLSEVVAGLAVGPDGTVYIADTNNNRVRVVSPNSIISTYAGNGDQGFSGDGGVPTAAAIGWPAGLALGADGSLYIGDSNTAVRRVIPAKKGTSHKGGK